MSDLEKLSDDQLGNLIKLSIHLINKKAKDVDFTDFNDVVDEEALDVLDEICRFFGIKYSGVKDYTFIVALLKLNENHKKGDTIIRPTLGEYEVVEYEFVWEKRKNVYSNDISSYIEVDSELLSRLRDIDEYSTYDGDLIDTDTFDSEWIEDGVVKIIKLD